MQKQYDIQTSTRFAKDYKKYCKKNKNFKSIITSVVKTLSYDPHYYALKTHKVNTRIWGNVYSSRLTGDLRILWKFSAEKIDILLLELGGHSGKNSVYR